MIIIIRHAIRALLLWKMPYAPCFMFSCRFRYAFLIWYMILPRFSKICFYDIYFHYFRRFHDIMPPPCRHYYFHFLFLLSYMIFRRHYFSLSVITYYYYYMIFRYAIIFFLFCRFVDAVIFAWYDIIIMIYIIITLHFTYIIFTLLSFIIIIIII